MVSGSGAGIGGGRVAVGASVLNAIAALSLANEATGEMLACVSVAMFSTGVPCGFVRAAGVKA